LIVLEMDHSERCHHGQQELASTTPTIAATATCSVYLRRTLRQLVTAVLRPGKRPTGKETQPSWKRGVASDPPVHGRIPISSCAEMGISPSRTDGVARTPIQSLTSSSVLAGKQGADAQSTAFARSSPRAAPDALRQRPARRGEGAGRHATVRGCRIPGRLWPQAYRVGTEGGGNGARRQPAFCRHFADGSDSRNCSTGICTARADRTRTSSRR